MRKPFLDKTDEELMVLYQDGEYQAFECLYSRHSGRIYEYLRSKVQADAAQDLLQVVFMKVHRSRSQYSSQYPVLPWLFTITRNTVVDFLKSSERKLSSKTVSDEALLNSLVENLPEPSQEAALFPLGELVHALPEPQRQAIELRYLKEWTFEKIAEEMKTSPQNIRQLVSRGIRKIRHNLKGGPGA